MTDSKDNAEPRKASDILLALEAKVEQLLSLARSQDMNIKILSNKFNALSEEFKTLTVEDDGRPAVPQVNAPTSPYSGEIVNSKVEYQLPLEKNPNGFRRTSRPETFMSEPVTALSQSRAPEPELLYNPKKQASKPSAPVPNRAQVVPAQNPQLPPSMETVTKAPVVQRVLDKNSKVVFLASVEVINTQTNKIEYTARTSSMGKWQASLPPGTYKVNVKKQEAASKSKINASTEFSVANTGTLIELPDLIAR